MKVNSIFFKSLEEQRRIKDARLLTFASRSLKSFLVWIHIVCWCWSTELCQARGLPESFRALQSSFYKPTLDATFVFQQVLALVIPLKEPILAVWTIVDNLLANYPDLKLIMIYWKDHAVQKIKPTSVKLCTNWALDKGSRTS